MVLEFYYYGGMFDFSNDILKSVDQYLIFYFLILRRPLGESKLRYKKMERNLSRKKNKKYPKRPKMVANLIEAYEDPNILQEFGNNLRNTSRFYIDTILLLQSVFTVFASQQIIDMIKIHIPSDERTYMIDGTFSVVPISGFYQLLVIYIQFKNDVRFI